MWAKVEKLEVEGWEGSKRHKINRADQAYGDAEAEMVLERMRKEVANAYERIEEGMQPWSERESRSFSSLRC